MSTFTIVLSQDPLTGKISITTSPIPEGGNLSEIQRMGTRLVKMAENFSSNASLWEKLVRFFLG